MQVKSKLIIISVYPSAKRPTVYVSGIDSETGGQVSMGFPIESGADKFKPGEVVDLNVIVKPDRFQGKQFLNVVQKI